MKLLIDENLSPKLTSILASTYPGSKHVRDLALASSSDTRIWDFAKSDGFVIISKDSDFHQRSLLLGAPPKVIGLLVGNCSTTTISRLIFENSALISAFESDPEASFLSLTV